MCFYSQIGTCTDGKVRLSGSNYAHVGVVEVCTNGTWVTICDENWDDDDAAVTCHQLGYSSYGLYCNQTQLTYLLIIYRSNGSLWCYCITFIFD